MDCRRGLAIREVKLICRLVLLWCASGSLFSPFFTWQIPFPVESPAEADLREAVFAAPDIDIDEVFTSVYAEMTPGLEAQRQQLRTEIRREG